MRTPLAQPSGPPGHVNENVAAGLPDPPARLTGHLLHCRRRIAGQRNSEMRGQYQSGQRPARDLDDFVFVHDNPILNRFIGQVLTLGPSRDGQGWSAERVRSSKARVEMPNVAIRTADPTDFETICALNLAEVRHTSAMDVARLTALHALSCYHQVATREGVTLAFVLAMCSGAPYENENFEWFSKRYPRFVYVDRVVVSSTARGLRLGSLLYEALFRYARANAFPLVACEYNIVPPNEPSRSFHDKFGFKEQGTQWVANGAKRVSLQVAQA